MRVNDDVMLIFMNEIHRNTFMPQSISGEHNTAKYYYLWGVYYLGLEGSWSLDAWNWSALR
jgi:hypothetical protein